MSLLKEELTNNLIPQVNILPLGLNVSSTVNHYSRHVVEELHFLATPYTPSPRILPFVFSPSCGSPDWTHYFRHEINSIEHKRKTSGNSLVFSGHYT